MVGTLRKVGGPRLVFEIQHVEKAGLALFYDVTLKTQWLMVLEHVLRKMGSLTFLSYCSFTGEPTISVDVGTCSWANALPDAINRTTGDSSLKEFKNVKVAAFWHASQPYFFRVEAAQKARCWRVMFVSDFDVLLWWGSLLFARQYWYHIQSVPVPVWGCNRS